MKNKIYTQFMHMVRQTHMTRTEKNRVLHAILSTAPTYAHAKTTKPIQSPWSIFTVRAWIHEHKSVTAVLATMVIIVMGGGGVASASSNALPGDTLYGLKVDVVEPVKVALRTTPESRATAQSDLVNRRLEEAETLALREELNQDKLDVITTLIDEHAEGFVQEVNKVREKGDDMRADDISVALQADLNAHAVLLAKIDRKSNRADFNSASSDSALMMTMSAPAPEMATEVSSAPADVTVESVSRSAKFAPEISVESSDSVPAVALKSIPEPQKSLVRVLEGKISEKAVSIYPTVPVSTSTASSSQVDDNTYKRKKESVKKYIEETKEKIKKNNEERDVERDMERDIESKREVEVDEGDNGNDNNYSNSSWKREIIDDSTMSLDEAVESFESAEENEKRGDKNKAFEELRKSERATGKANTLIRSGLKFK